MAHEIAEMLAMLLPPGLLYDSPEIYAEVAKLPVIPLEDVRQHWQSYTSMCKKLRDPTACRLENFWWHVWGSDRRNLSGKTLARLWKDIASGPTFVPLLGPPRRYPGPPMPHTRSMHESDSNANSQAGIAKGTRGDLDMFHPEQAPQNLTPSSSRPPPSHPILKNSRGPSSSGPRPTARFVDVPDSEDENAQQSSSSQQSASGASQSDGSTRNRNPARFPSRSRSPAKPERKPASTKKFVASTTASKRRPVLPRRQSSQSSTGSAGGSSDNGPKEGGSYGKKQSSQQSFTASPQEDGFLKGLGAARLPPHAEDPPPTAKAQGKRARNESNPGNPIIVKTSPQPDAHGATSAPKRLPSPLSQGQNAEDGSPRLPMPGGSPKRPGPSAKVLGKQPEMTAGSAGTPATRVANPLGIYDSIAERTGYQAPAGPDTPADQPDEEKAARARKAARDANPKGAPSMARSKSNSESKRMSSGSTSAANFKSPSVVGMSKFAVTGGFDFETPRARPSEEDLPPLGADQPDLRRSSVLDSKFSPTQPSPMPAPPMGRSKSQLTLLLERDKARIGDRHKVGRGPREQ